MDVLDLIDEIEDLIESGSNVPFTSKVMVQKEEILKTLDDLRIKLPDEIKQAAWIKEDRKRIIEEANKEAEKIIQETRKKLEELVNEQEVLKEAKMRAQNIINQARESSMQMKKSTLEYSDRLLLNTQENLKAVITTLNENRGELRKMDMAVSRAVKEE